MTETKPTKVKDLSDLIDLINAGKNEFFIALAGGGLRSSKTMWYDNEKERFEVFHSIDGSIHRYSHKRLFSETNIGRALDEGVLYAD